MQDNKKPVILGNPQRSAMDTIVLRRSGSAFCPVCRDVVDLLSFSMAAKLFRTDVAEIDSLVQQGRLHRLHNRRGAVLICTNSLYRCLSDMETQPLDPHYLADIHRTWDTAVAQ